jgi:hypothetical protein
MVELLIQRLKLNADVEESLIYYNQEFREVFDAYLESNDLWGEPREDFNVFEIVGIA